MDLNHITIDEKKLLDYHLQQDEIWCCNKKCCSQYGGNFFGKPLYLAYGEEFDINLLYCKQCWLHNFRQIRHIIAEPEEIVKDAVEDTVAEDAEDAEDTVAEDAEDTVAEDAEDTVAEDAAEKTIVNDEAKGELGMDTMGVVATEVAAEVIPILSIIEAREMYSNIEKDCFVFNCNGNVQARCFWCKKYSDGLFVYQTCLDNNFNIIVAGHEYNCIS
jgi:hypothetical protein